MFKFYEFFAGGGMARAGFGAGWVCLFANDCDQKKSAIYRANWGDDVLKTAAVQTLQASYLPGVADLAWASFPCQDLSLAGNGDGLRGARSGTFWPCWNLLKAVSEEGRAPSLVVLENVCGALTAHGGQDFSALCTAFQQAAYRVGALVVDAAIFLPHSRPRLFVIGVREDLPIPANLQSATPTAPWHTRALQTAFGRLPKKLKENWLWWSLPLPAQTPASLAELLEENQAWRSADETRRLLSLMDKINLAKVRTAQACGQRVVGAIYKRTRRDERGGKVQRAEVRFDNLAGCLRTPAGGSSRQLILVVEGEEIYSRLLSARETARLMGLPDAYKLPENYNEAYHLTGDGVAVPVVRHLAAHLFEPILKQNAQDRMNRIFQVNRIFQDGQDDVKVAYAGQS